MNCCFVESEVPLNIFFQTLRTHAKMQHNVILPTESKKGKKLGPRKNKTIRTAKPQEVPSIMRPNVVLPNVAPLNLASIHNSQDSQSVASEDSWAPQVSCFFAIGSFINDVILEGVVGEGDSFLFLK